MHFVADAMLGKLAKWLRILGHDTVYEKAYPQGSLDRLIREGEGRILLTRNVETAKGYPDAIFIGFNRVGEQLNELNGRILLTGCPREWFTRCVNCNTPLGRASPEEAREAVPEYVYYENREKIRYCPSCGRYYWPGSHRKRMLGQLKKWGLIL